MKIAIQSNGRLRDASIRFLRSQGLEFQPNDRELITPCANYDIEILSLRCADIPEYVRRGAVDCGIVGQNTLAENGFVGADDYPPLRQLGFGQCRLVIAVPKGSPISSPGDLEGERIATSYPNLLSAYLRSQNIRAAIIPLRGSVEIAPRMNLADAICDLVQSGKTLEANGLRSLVTVMESQAVLVGNKSIIPAEAGIYYPPLRKGARGIYDRPFR